MSTTTLSPVDQTAASLFGIGSTEPEAVYGDLSGLAETYDPTPHEYLDDPVGWVRDVLGEVPWSMQREILESVYENRYTAVQSCHDTGKSYIAARAAAWWLGTRPLGDAFVVTTAPTWRQVQAILWREIRRAHRRAGLEGRTTLDARWYMGGRVAGDPDEELVAMGNKPSEYDPDAFQGIHAKYVLVIIDEACGVPKNLYDAVDSLATNDLARVLAIGNPDDPASHFQAVCKPGSGWNTIQIGYKDTPNFTGEIEELPDTLADLLIGRTWVEERVQRWGEKSPTYIAKVLGLFPDITDDTLLGPAALRKGQHLSLKGLAKGRFGADIARLGDDETVVYRNRGGQIRLELRHSKADTRITSNVFLELMNRHKNYVPMTIDHIGVGAGVYDNLNHDGMRVTAFEAGGAAIESDRYVNRRAECFWEFKMMVEKGEIDLPGEGEDEELIAQLGSIKWYLDSRGRIGIESKKEMKKRGLPSPDRADAAVMSCFAGTVEYVPERTGREESTITGDLLERTM